MRWCFFLAINSQLLLKNVHRKCTVVFNNRKDFFLKKAVALCIRETDSLEMWRVFAHFFKVLEAMTAPLSRGGCPAVSEPCLYSCADQSISNG